MSEYSKEHWDALVSIYENNGRTRVSAHEIGIIWADQHIKDLTKQLAELEAKLEAANARARHYITKSDDLTKQLEAAKEYIANLEVTG